MARIAKKNAEAVPALPNFSDELIGLNAPLKSLQQALQSKRLHSAYLLAGRQGIGKSKLALQFAASLFSPQMSHEPVEIDMFGEAVNAKNHDSEKLNIDWNAPAISQMQNRSNPDFLYISPAYDDKKKRFKDLISAEEVRKITRFTHLKASNNWKIIIIDPVELMNNFAANSLLKCLEEPPPQTIFLLISHNPSRLLPTIRSRCLNINFQSLSFADFTQILSAKNVHENHNLLYHLTNGSVGLALELHHVDFVQYWQKLLEMLETPSNQRLSIIFNMAEKVNKDSNFLLKHWQLLVEFIMFDLAHFQATQLPRNNIIPQSLLHKSAPTKPHEAWLDIISEHSKLIDNAAILYLDKKQVIINSLSYF